LEYPVPEGSDIIAEAKKCLAYVKSCLVWPAAGVDG
jgi:hypothetical protein